jgi:hypothetical protein
MLRMPVVLLCALMALASGCRGSGQPDRIPIQPRDPEELVMPPVSPADDWAGPLEENPSTVFVPAMEAEECPSFKLYRPDNSSFKMKPGEMGGIEPHYVTILVFWKMERLRGRMLARHVSDLARKYRQWRVRAIGIVEEGVSVAAVDEFQRAQGLVFRIYYDLYDALDDLRDEIGATDPDRPTAAVIILDRQMRLRFYRSEMSLAGGLAQTGRGRGPGTGEVGESAPQGKSVEDYLVRIIKEG